MSNAIRKIRRNRAERLHGTRDHNFKAKMNFKRKQEEEQVERLKKKKDDPSA